jgi:hypothetical protein
VCQSSAPDDRSKIMPDLPSFYGNPIDTPDGHRWAGRAPASTGDEDGPSPARGELAAWHNGRREEIPTGLRDHPTVDARFLQV